ncbi:hypothetical protein F6476_10535 [Pseudomonas umsongensis]|jgi:hypothetical protein|uniref:hypothetical protein n=1 Tax=Pseudomonas TaxID=286 RepID=UPI0003431E8C|nr:MULTISPECIES: hypothetical protein [Pseudomonas]EPA98251.1 hypothetical protein PG5_12700 [Pseudomonas sp. G5(2012)]MBT9572204.1 hypothetical protein [Pseudomonas umsongensis]QFG29598.1 hypothetical protein F6476_10535 [Pseudomonas umsongensis]
MVDANFHYCLALGDEIVPCLLSLPTTRVIRWLDALQQFAITRFCARPTWTLSDPTSIPIKSGTPLSDNRT